MIRLKRFSAQRKIFLLLFLAVLTVYGTVFYQRLADYQFWLENDQHYVVDDVVAMSTMDAYYWLKMARELDAGTLGKGRVESIKGYPDQVPLAIKDTPSLLAELISLGKNFTDGNYYRSGLLLIPLLAGLFVFPLFFCCYRLGFGASAILGGLIGAFSRSYYDRTMMGRVDTDLLNTFFPLAAAGFMLPISKQNSWRVNAALALGAGLTMNLFTRWYQQPSFILVYLAVLAVYLLLARVPWKQLLLILLIFLLASGPEYLVQIMGSLRTFLNAYVSPPPTGLIAWPNVLKSVAEAKQRSLGVKLAMLHGCTPLVMAGFAGLGFLCFWRFKKMLPLSPLLVLGAWSLLGPDRFLMYLAPLIGVGVGVLIELLVKYGGERIRLKPLLIPLVSISCMVVLFFSTAAYTGFSSKAAPSLNAATTRALLDVKRLVPQHSAMFTPFWEYGYALMEIGDFATYHDGGLQGGIRSTLTSQATTSPRQEEMVSLISYLEDNGFNPLAERISKEQLSPAQMEDLVFSYPGPFRGENVYVLYLEGMIRKFTAMSNLGTWDFAKKSSAPMDCVTIKNDLTLVNQLMTGSDGSGDPKRVVINHGKSKIPIRAALFVNNGQVVKRTDYADPHGSYLEILMKNQAVYMVLMVDERMFRSNFNQQYLLGNYDRRYFEEVYNNFPVARVLKVKTRAGNQADQPGGAHGTRPEPGIFRD